MSMNEQISLVAQTIKCLMNEQNYIFGHELQ